MGIFEIADPSRIEALYAGWPETFIWSFLQGYMGFAWADHPCSPRSAKIMAGDFCLFAGKPNVDLILHRPKGRERAVSSLCRKMKLGAGRLSKLSAIMPGGLRAMQPGKILPHLTAAIWSDSPLYLIPTFSSGALMSCYSAFCRKVNGRTISAPNSRIMPIMSDGGSVWQRSIRVRRLPALPPIPFTGAALKLKLTHGWISAGRALPRHAAHG